MFQAFVLVVCNGGQSCFEVDLDLRLNQSLGCQNKNSWLAGIRLSCRLNVVMVAFPLIGDALRFKTVKSFMCRME